MKALVLAAACVAWLGIGLGPGRSAFAQTAGAAEPLNAEDARKSEGRRHFLRGVELAQNEEWDAALAEFLASREAFPTKVGLRNAAICLRQLKRYAEAFEMYRELEARFGSTFAPDETAAVKDALDQLRQRVGSIGFEGVPAGASIVVDGRDYGTAPLAQPIVVVAGTHLVRVVKEGYVPYETQLIVAGKQQRSVRAVLQPLAQSGRLNVSEVAGEALDVVIDGATVGKTPWSGVLSVGLHTVALRGAGNQGTPPSAAQIKAGATSSLALRAEKLEARLRIEPTPSHALVFLDGVPLGNGTWEGRLRAGRHRVELTAPGFLPLRREATAAARSRGQDVLRLELERNLADPMWNADGFTPHLYAQIAAGPALAATLAGGLDAACGRDECSDRSRPFGIVALGRAGYQPVRRLGLELGLGYLSLSESATRRVRATAEGVPFDSADYRDEASLAGPLAAASASYTLLDRLPLTFRLGAGTARVRASFENRGTFTGVVRGGESGEEEAEVTQVASVPERSELVWLPFIQTEAQVGYRFGHFAIDLGVAAWLFFPPETLRTGRTGLSARPGDRRLALQDAGEFESGQAVRPGTLSLPRETALGTFVALSPLLSARWDF